MNILEQVALMAIRLGVNTLEIEYKDGQEEIFAIKGGVGYGIARFRSSSREAASLRDQLYRIVKKKHCLSMGDRKYELRGRVYDSFGEDAFRLDIRRL